MKRLFIIALAAVAAFVISCNKDEKVTNTLTIGSDSYPVQLSAGINEDNGVINFSCDIHFTDDAPRNDQGFPIGVIVCEGVVGTANLPSDDFTWDYIPFKSGTAKTWVTNDHLGIKIDGVLDNGQKVKLSVQSDE